MLESLRAAQSTWLGKAVLAIIFMLIIIGLSFFGIADLFRSRTNDWVADVGGRQVSAEAFRQAYQNGLEQMQQKLRRPVTSQQARQMGLDRQVLSRLVTNALLDRQAEKLGLAISDPQVGTVITEDPTFAGSDGRFDRAKFNRFMENARMTEQSFIREQRGSYLRQELEDGVIGSMTAPRAAVEALHRLQAETRSLDMVVLAASVLGDIPAPEEAALQTFYDARKGQFSAPEFRKFSYLAVTPALVAKPDQVSAEDVAKAYEAAPDSKFGAPERRTLQQILFPSQTEAEAAALRIAAGTSFAAVATERDVSGKDLELGTVSKAQIFDKPVADAAFALPENGTSDPVKGAFGTVLVHVTAITPGDRKPIEEVAPVLRKQIAEAAARTRDALRDIHDKIEDARASGKPLAEAASTVGLEVRTVDAIDATGRDKNAALVDMPDRDAVLRAVFASDVGVDNDVVQTREGDQIWFEVAAVEPGRQLSFAEAKSAVETSWRKDETEKRLVAKADELVKTVQGGGTMEQVAEAAGKAEIRHVGNVRRSGTEGLPGPVAAKAFDTAVGAAGTADGDDGTLVVFKVLDSAVPPLDPDAPQAKQLDQQYRAWLSDDILTAYLTRLQDTAGIKLNNEVLQSVTGASG